MIVMDSSGEIRRTRDGQSLIREPHRFQEISEPDALRLLAADPQEAVEFAARLFAPAMLAAIEAGGARGYQFMTSALRREVWKIADAETIATSAGWLNPTGAKPDGAVPPSRVYDW